MKYTYSEEDDYISDLRAEREYYRKRDAELMKALDCRDPSHEGCERCCENQQIEWE